MWRVCWRCGRPEGHGLTHEDSGKFINHAREKVPWSVYRQVAGLQHWTLLVVRQLDWNWSNIVCACPYSRTIRDPYFLSYMPDRILHCHGPHVAF